MALTPVYFQPDSFQSANPVLSGMAAGNNLIQQMIQNRYLAPTLQQQLLGDQLKNTEQGITNQYLPQSLQSDIGLKQAQAKLYGAQTQFFPLTAQGSYLRGAGDYMRGLYLNNPAMWASRFQNNPTFQNLVANNPEVAKQYTNLMAGSVMNGSPMSGAQMPALPGGNPQGMGMLPQQASSALPISPQDVSNVQSAAANDYLKKTTTSQIANQRQYSQILDNLMQQASPLMPSVAKYAGAGGAAKLSYDRVGASLGANNPDYTNYLMFRTIAPNIANEMRRTLGGQATDSERKVMESLVNPKYWDSNPELAIQQFSTLQNLYKNAVDPALAKSMSQVQQNLQGKQQPASPQSTKQPNFSQSDLEYTAQKYGMTVDQVKQKLGMQ